MSIRANRWFNWSLFGLPLAWLWFTLINHLRVEWTVNPQYNYGWAVPVLCGYLIWQNLQKSGKEKAQSGNQTSKLGTRNSKLETENLHLPSSIYPLLLVACALLYAPTRLIEEANPDWRLVSWALALEVTGITLCVARIGFSVFRFPLSTFPLGFFLVAVPWPTVIEGPVIQALTRAVSGMTVEIMGLLGIPAMRHGNVIELSTGVLGIDEACSGIRSLQATLMISLFLGEVYALSAKRRVLFVISGLALAFFFNVARTLVLTMVAARKGIAAVSSWHDPAGVTILVACFISLWLVGLWLAGGKAESRKQKAEKESEAALPTSDLRPRISAFSFQFSAFVLCVWILAGEVSVEWWYRSHEARLPRATQWTVAWPTNNSAFKEVSIPERTRQILRYDEARHATWTDAGKNWQIIFLRWNPGRTALYLARNHTPEICLPAAGRRLISSSDLQWLEVNDLHLPFREYSLEEQGRPLRVYYCLWDDRASEQGFASMSLNYANRLTPVLAGLRNPGQRSIEIALRGVADEADATAALQSQLEKIITIVR